MYNYSSLAIRAAYKHLLWILPTGAPTSSCWSSRPEWLPFQNVLFFFLSNAMNITCWGVANQTFFIVSTSADICDRRLLFCLPETYWSLSVLLSSQINSQKPPGDLHSSLLSVKRRQWHKSASLTCSPEWNGKVLQMSLVCDTPERNHKTSHGDSGRYSEGFATKSRYAWRKLISIFNSNLL